jgi:hypothetical protein
MIRGDYLRRGEESSAREEGEAAGAHDAKRISDALQQAGSSISKVGQGRLTWKPSRQRRRRTGRAIPGPAHAAGYDKESGSQTTAGVSETHPLS